MKLIDIKVEKYKSIEKTSGLVTFEQVTCLVGKNESGKTAFLQALYKLNPVDSSNGSFDLLEYPRRDLNKYKAEHEKNPARIVSASFELSQDEIQDIESKFGEGILTESIIRVYKNYKNEITFSLTIDEAAYVKHVVDTYNPPKAIQKIKQSTTVKALVEFIKTVEDTTQIQELVAQIAKYDTPSKVRQAIFAQLTLPKFVYFADYSVMRGINSIPLLKEKKDAKPSLLDDADRTFLGLISKAGTSLEEILGEQDYEKQKASLESASNEITDEVFRFWTQNKELEVEFDITDRGSAPPHERPPVLHVRIKNKRHRVTVPFDERSRGFIWFFSFLAYFSDLEKQGEDLILLLDEPGLSLHAKAQADFLKFIYDRLATKYQVIYTTHSPFMVDSNHLEAVRTVEDKGDEGTVVSSDFLRTTKETIFPLQAAMGYDLAQSLFIGPNCLLVEGPSDLIYLRVLSDACRSKGKAALDERWVLVPVGGADKISTFLALLGANQLNVAVLIDVSQKDLQRIKHLQDQHFLKPDSLLQITDVTGSKEADIEDLFEPSFFVDLVNGAYKDELAKKIAVTDLVLTGRIVKSIEEFAKTNTSIGKFDHYRPAAFLLMKQAELVKKLDNATLDRASKLFELANKLLP